MEGQLIIHGKPTEGELLSVGMFDGFEEKIYSDFFGSSTKPIVSPCYVFEIRRWKGVLYSVYSYYNDGKDKYGSGNGYCVVSFIIKGNHTHEYGKMMSALHRVYDTTLKGELNIIDESGKYLVPSLRDNIDLSILESICQNLISDFQWGIIPSSYNISKASDTTCCWNTDDAADSRVNDIIKQEGKIYISTKFLSISDRQQKQKESVQRKILSNERPEERLETNVNDNDSSDKMLAERIDKAEAKIIRNVEYLLSTYLPADKAGNFRDLDSKSPATRSSNSFSVTKFANWVTLVNCILLFVCLFYTCRGNNSSNGYIDVDVDSTNVEMATISKLQLDSIKHERDSLRNIVNVFNQNQWFKINVDAITQDKPYLTTSDGTLSIVFNKTYPQENLPGIFKILKGDAAEIMDNIITPKANGIVTIGYVQQGAVILTREIEIRQ